MPFWGWVLLIAGLSALALASIFVIVHHTHRRMPSRETAEGSSVDISAPLPMEVHREQDVMTERELRDQRTRDAERAHEEPRARW